MMDSTITFFICLSLIIFKVFGLSGKNSKDYFKSKYTLNGSIELLLPYIRTVGIQYRAIYAVDLNGLALTKEEHPGLSPFPVIKKWQELPYILHQGINK